MEFPATITSGNTVNTDTQPALGHPETLSLKPTSPGLVALPSHDRMEPPQVQSVTERKRANPQKTPVKELARASRREEVVQLHREGLTYVEIAERLGVCPDTVWRDLRPAPASRTRPKNCQRSTASNCSAITCKSWPKSSRWCWPPSSVPGA
jgi:Homeodomain-like domain